MVGPEFLEVAIDGGVGEGLCVGVVGGKGHVLLGVPVSGDDHDLEG